MTASASDVSDAVGSGGPRVNALQKLWLREIGIEKTWLPMAELVVPVPAALSDAPASPVREVIVPPLVPEAPAAVVSLPPELVAPRRPSVATGSPAKRVALKEVAIVVPPLDSKIANASFEEIRDQVLSCSACGLHQGRRHAVFGDGVRPARWMIIGEAPGEQEDRQGLPFVGRSGQLLDAMLGAVGMSRTQDVFIANVIKCRPPGNRNPKVDEIAACSPYLTRQIELVQPEQILVLGRFAAQTLLKTDATIGSLRGRQHEWVMADGRRVPVVVSYHPAYLLRSPLEKARAWQDLQLALTTAS